MPVLAGFLLGTSVFLLLAYMVRAQALRPVESRLRVLSPRPSVGLSASGDGAALLRRDPSSTPLGKLLTGNQAARRWRFDLERAGLNLRPSEYFLLRLGIGVLTVMMLTAFGRSGLVFLISLPLGVAMYMLPSYWVRFRISRRLHAIEKQLVETVSLISNGVRSGFAFSQALDVAAKRVGPPMSVELGRVLLDVNLGMSTENALLEFNARIGSDDLDMVVTAILIQRQSGGNLAEVLENVASTMRDRERIQGEIKTMTSQQRFTGWVLTLWPASLGLLFAAINPSMTSLLWKTDAGQVMLVIWVILNILGYFTIKRILDIDI